MDINLPLPIIPATGSSGSASIGDLQIKLNQILEAKVITTQVALDTIMLRVADKTLTLQSKQPLTLTPGQTLQLQVVKLLPTPEFRLLPTPLPNLTNPDPANSNRPAPPITETLILVNSTESATRTAASPPLNNTATPPPPLTAKVVSVINDKVTLQFLSMHETPQLAVPTEKPANPTVTLALKQLLIANPPPGSTQNEPGKTTGATEPPNYRPAVAQTLLPGMSLRLQPLDSGPKPTFAIIPPENTQQILNDAHKQLLPIQASPVPLLNQLQQVLKTPGTEATVAETLKQLAREILAEVPTRNNLTDPMQLKRVIAESGLFMESKLATLLKTGPEPVLDGDLKLKLHKLLLFLEKTIAEPGQDEPDAKRLLGEILQKTQGALAKMTLDQLNSVPRDESPKQAWLMELPFFYQQNLDSVTIEIEQDRSGDSDSEQKNWAVSITITPPELATIHCKITCYDGSVNTRFWSEAAETVIRINGNLDYLKQQFEEKGITPGFMEAFQGKPAKPDANKKPTSTLLNLKV